MQKPVEVMGQRLDKSLDIFVQGKAVFDAAIKRATFRGSSMKRVSGSTIYLLENRLPLMNHGRLPSTSFVCLHYCFIVELGLTDDLTFFGKACEENFKLHAVADQWGVIADSAAHIVYPCQPGLR